MNIHDLIGDVTRSQNRSNFEIDNSPSIFELQRRSKAQNFGNAHGDLSGISTSGITSGKKVCRAQNGGHFENFEILNTASIWPQIWKDRPKVCQKKFFYGDDVIDDVTGWPQSFSLYSCLGVAGATVPLLRYTPLTWQSGSQPGFPFGRFFVN